jgi:YfiH family protein
VRFLRSSVLAVPHGFSLRTGGVSEGPFASLNLGTSVGDDGAAVAENLRRLAADAGRAADRLSTVHQVHGAVVVRAAAGRDEVDADGLWTDDASGSWVGVRAADCVPILLSTEDGRAVAAVHSGWRGTLLGVVAQGVEALVRTGAPAATLRAAVGPCIQACCYEVGPDLAERFGAAFSTAVVRGGGVRPHLDLALAVRSTLLGAGLLPEHVDLQTACTACDAARFFSHRRDGGVTGRHLAFIAPAPLS